MRYLLDTNAISGMVEDPRGSVATRLRQVLASASITTSIIVVAELRFGYSKISSARLKDAYEAIFETIEIESWEAPFDHVYGDLRSTLERKGRTMGAMDLMIAAHALATDAIIVTDDQAFFHVPGLRAENWLRDPPAEFSRT